MQKLCQVCISKA
nr:unnamed protein product [Callosobruchus chinensis]